VRLIKTQEGCPLVIEHHHHGTQHKEGTIPTRKCRTTRSFSSCFRKIAQHSPSDKLSSFLRTHSSNLVRLSFSA
jgi:hypothetical protein